MTDTVLVTGVSGFIGAHIAATLLQRGYAVRGSIRTPARAEEVRTAMRAAGADPARLDLVQLDLLHDEGWASAADGCRYVLHVASPFTATAPKNPQDLIRPAVQGTTRAVGAAFDAGAERVVLTSSLAAVENAPAAADHVFTAADWTEPNGRGVGAYTASKTRAERAALAIAAERGTGDRLAVINPGAVLGPLLSDDPGTSVAAIQQIMSGAMPMIPDLRMPFVHVRDIAEAHIAAMTSSAAAGNRTIVATDTSSLIDAAAVLRARLPEECAKMPRRAMPTWLTRAASFIEPQLRAHRALIGTAHRFDRGPAEALLGRALTPIPDTIEETGRSLVARGLV